MVRLVLFSLLLVMSVACQKNTYELANAEESADSPDYTSEVDINHPGTRN